MIDGSSMTIVAILAVALLTGQTLHAPAHGLYTIPFDTCRPPDSITCTLPLGVVIVPYGYRHRIPPLLYLGKRL